MVDALILSAQAALSTAERKSFGLLPPPMKTRLLTLVFMHILASYIQADTIIVRDVKIGERVAEVDVDSNGAQFNHKGRTLSIRRNASVMEQRARKLLCPRVQFREASLEDIASRLRQPFPLGSENEGSPPRPTINFVTIDQAKRDLSISIYLEQVSLYDLLAALAKKYGLIISYENYAIFVTDPKQAE